MDTNWLLKLPFLYALRVVAVAAALSISQFFCYSAFRLIDQPDYGIRIAEGFKITRITPTNFSADLQAMTFDSAGRLIVSSPGKITTLFDTNNDGLIDKETIFANVDTRGGICYFDRSLYFYNNGWLCRLSDADGDGVSDSPLERLIELKGDDPNFQSIRKGPDGWWYIGVGYGNNLSKDNRILKPLPIRYIEGGAIIRLSPDFRIAQLFAHGFLVPSGFDFNPDGELLVCDQGTPQSAFLVWNSSTRFLKVRFGFHYGWITSHSAFPLFKPDYYFDEGKTIFTLGFAVPGRLTVYRHKQFPEFFKNGAFVPLWSSGKILFFPELPEKNQEPYSPFPFIEATAGSDFSPSDIVVGPDGSLYISTGGAKTQPAIYRVQYISPPPKKPAEVVETLTPLLTVLNAPQPLEAWSRALWMPSALKLGRIPFEMASVSELYTVDQRIRAIEILIELFDGFRPQLSRTITRSAQPKVRACSAFALQHYDSPIPPAILADLALDPDPKVRQKALETFAVRFRDFANEDLLPVLIPQLDHPDDVIRFSTARLSAMLNERYWNGFLAKATNALPRAQLTAALAISFKYFDKPFKSDLISLALNIFNKNNDPTIRLDALRVLIVGLGDYPQPAPAPEIHSPFLFNAPTQELATLAPKILQSIRPAFPSQDPFINIELVKLLCFLQDQNPQLPRLLLSQCSVQSPTQTDFYYLSALSRLPPPKSAYQPPPTAAVLMRLLNKLNVNNPILSRHNSELLNSLISELIKADPALPEMLLRHPDYLNYAFSYLTPFFDPQRQLRASQLFLDHIQRGGKFTFTPHIIQWLGTFTNAVIFNAIRSQWNNPYLREDILLALSNLPMPVDREKFLSGLSSARPDVVMACLDALNKLPPDNNPANLLPIYQLLRRLVRDPAQKPLREKVLALLEKQTGSPHRIQENTSDPDALARLYEPLFVRFANLYPTLGVWIDGASDPESRKILNLVRFSQPPPAMPQRGAIIFKQKNCALCHNPDTDFAPPLQAGINRLSLQSFVYEVLFPSQKVSKQYQPTEIILANKSQVVGIERFASPDAVLIQIAPAKTIRINPAEVISLRKANYSLMPAGLLNGATLQEIVDLYSYIQKLQ